MGQSVPSLASAQDALAQLATQDALEHLESALRSLEGLSGALLEREPLPMQEKRELEKSLLRLRRELRDAGVLAEQGLAYCRDWAEQLQPPPVYASNGGVVGGPGEPRRLSIEG